VAIRCAQIWTDGSRRPPAIGGVGERLHPLPLEARAGAAMRVENRLTRGCDCGYDEFDLNAPMGSYRKNYPTAGWTSERLRAEMTRGELEIGEGQSADSA